jgi:hypothetical protein
MGYIPCPIYVQDSRAVGLAAGVPLHLPCDSPDHLVQLSLVSALCLTITYNFFDSCFVAECSVPFLGVSLNSETLNLGHCVQLFLVSALCLTIVYGYFW